MVELGARAGVRTSALLTDMSTPLGRAVGNAVEVAESVEVLAGGGPADVVELTVALAREMVALAGLDADPATVLASGAAPWTAGGPWWPPRAATRTRRCRRPAHDQEWWPASPACWSGCDALAVGVAAWRLGAGRARREHDVQAAAGILCLVKPGDTVTAGQPLFELHTDTPDAVPGALAALESGVVVGDGPAATRPPLIGTVLRP